MSRARLVALLVGLVVVAPSLAGAQTFQAFVKIEAGGTVITGPASVPQINNFDLHDFTDILAYGAGATVPRPDPGGSVGTPIYRPVSFVKAWDGASPLLFQALAQHDVIQAEFRFFRNSQGGLGPENFFTIKVENGLVLDISPAGSVASMAQRETVSLDFQRLTLRDEINNSEYQIQIEMR